MTERMDFYLRIDLLFIVDNNLNKNNNKVPQTLDFTGFAALLSYSG